MYHKEVELSILEGLVLEKFEVLPRERIRIVASGREFLMYHVQDCCETVVIESILGKPERCIGETINDAITHSNSGREADHFTWTYYTIRTQRETLVIRWYGSSNGYYSEKANFFEITD